MTSNSSRAHNPFGEAAARIFASNDCMNQTIIENLVPAAWRARLSTKPSGTVRTIAAIFTHMHNIRAKWIRLTAPHLEVPPLLNRASCTPQQASVAFAASARLCGQMLAEALDGEGSGIRVFLRDGWAQPWPAGPEMLCYMIAHEAHHRGQVCMLAHQLGFPLPKPVGAALWNWEKLLK